MFEKSARFYDAIYSFKDYASASDELRTLIQERRPGADTLLDVGCGTGKHLQVLQAHYRAEGLDINEDLLAVARAECPEVPFHLGDMVDFELDHAFDVVLCLFSSIGYVRTKDNLFQAVQNMSEHLNPSGVLLVEPWFSPEQYWRKKVVANFVDSPELKISWMYSHDIEENRSVFIIHYLVGTPQGVEHFTERHEMGLFTSEEYAQAFRAAGLTVEFREAGLFGRGLFLGQKSA
jgi:SAM-dependent methyltransferase